MRWQLTVETLWSDAIPQLLAPMPSGLKGREKAEFYRNKQSAIDLVKTLFPPDED